MQVRKAVVLSWKVGVVSFAFLHAVLPIRNCRLKVSRTIDITVGSSKS
jgi:hypothetical protein